MLPIVVFEPDLPTLLPQTAALLQAANLTVHPCVSTISLHGSRGLAKNFRPDSDIDLSLLVHSDDWRQASDQEQFFHDVTRLTLDHWAGPVELDLAVIFDRRGCGLRCFETRQYDPDLCPEGGKDCFGLYKIQKGFNGFVKGAGLDVRRMYPCLVIWRNPLAGAHCRG